jgi:diaminopimelate epimerase
MKSLRFTKMEGLGNDFIVVDATASPFTLSAGAIRRLADRRFGVGCDQVLVVEPARGMDDLGAAHSGVRLGGSGARTRADFRYRIFNADGGEVEQCGNGARCFVIFVREHGLTTKREIRVETAGGVIVPKLEDDGEVTVDMGIPRFAAADVPFIDGTGAVAEPLDVDGRIVTIAALSMGNPHAVQRVDNVETAPVSTQGPLRAPSALRSASTRDSCRSSIALPFGCGLRARRR